jgi:hypothetical protein
MHSADRPKPHSADSNFIGHASGPLLECAGFKVPGDACVRLNGKPGEGYNPNACAAPATVSECGLTNMPL